MADQGINEAKIVTQVILSIGVDDDIIGGLSGPDHLGPRDYLLDPLLFRLIPTALNQLKDDKAG